MNVETSIHPVAPATTAWSSGFKALIIILSVLEIVVFKITAAVTEHTASVIDAVILRHTGKIG